MSKEKLKIIGTTHVFKLNNLSFNVQILSHRKRIQQEYLVKPVSGSGEDWVASFEKTTKPLKKVNK